MSKPKTEQQVEGHAWAGIEGRYPAFDVSTAWGVCQCGARFDARTRDAKKRMHRAHAENIKALRQLRTDIVLVAAWALRDQQECHKLSDHPEDKADVAKNIAMIDRVEEAVDKLLAREAR